ncbi:MAG: hypothetical protein K0R80_2884 [Clostridia bacterium]|jgi:hypothetical protein|nr:hypothetical protein [Clostridia bacterium]
MKKTYIAGKITGDPNYKKKFEEAQKELEKEGHLVMSPAILPEGFPWEIYMPICYAMIDACEAIVFLPDWINSKGAKLEMVYASKKLMDIYFYEKEIKQEGVLVSDGTKTD